MINKGDKENRDVFEEMYNFKDKYKFNREALRSKYDTKPKNKKSEIKIMDNFLSTRTNRPLLIASLCTSWSTKIYQLPSL